MAVKSKDKPFTLRFRYECQDESFDSYLSHLRALQTSVVNFCTNRMIDIEDKIPEKELRQMVHGTMNNIKGKKSVSYLVQCGVRRSIGDFESYKANKEDWESSRDEKLKNLDKKFERKQIQENFYKKEKKRLNKPYKPFIRGGRKNFMKICKGEITHDEFVKNRMLPFYIIGEAPQGGNRHLTLHDDYTVSFNPDINHKYTLKLGVYTKAIEMFHRIVALQNTEDSVAITYEIDEKYVYVTVEQKKILFPEYSSKRVVDPIRDCWLGIDTNPNYIGWSVVKWNDSGSFDIIDFGVYDLKQFSDDWTELNKLKNVKSDDPRRLKINNKRRHEIKQIALELSNIATHYKCNGIAVEDLNMKSKDKQKGKNYNQLCNCSWLRNDFFNELDKMCRLKDLYFQKVKPEFSSTAGNFLFRHFKTPNGMSYMPDMVCSSVEIGRRAYEFSSQYIFNIRDKKKNIVNFDIQDFQELYVESLEEFGIEIEKGKDISKIHYVLKDSGLKVRVPLENSYLYKNPKEHRFFTSRSHVKVYGKPMNEHIVYK